MTLKDLPNLVTGARIVLAAGVFIALAAAGGLWPLAVDPAGRSLLVLAALAAFAVAGLTDFLDGWLARKLDARSDLGVMLDPIADKIAVVAALFGLCALDPALVIWPGALILMRELFVAGLRETGMKLAVTRLAKWKTTVQLVTLALAMLSQAWPPARAAAGVGLWLAACLTLWTGLDYLLKTLSELGTRGTPRP